MEQKKKIIFISSFIAVAVILVAVIFYQFVKLNTLRSKYQHLQDNIHKMEQQIEDMESQLPQG